MYESNFSLFIISCFLLFISSKHTIASNEEKDHQIEHSKFEFNFSFGTAMRLGNIESTDFESTSNNTSGYQYSLTAQYYVYKNLGMGAFFSDMWTPSSTIKNENNETIKIVTKYQYVGLLLGYGFYINKDFKMNLRISIGEINYFDAKRSTIVKGHTVTGGFHSHFIFKLNKYLGFSFLASIIPAHLNEVSVENRSTNFIISSEELTKKSIGKVEAGVGIIISL